MLQLETDPVINKGRNRPRDVIILTVLDISRGDEVTEKAYRALNGEYKLYTGDIGDNITSVMMIPAGIIISIFLIYEIFGKSKEKEQEVNQIE